MSIQNLKWVTNTQDPRLPNALIYVTPAWEETHEQAQANYREFLRGKTIGRPQATQALTVEQLEAMGMVGLYEITEENKVE